MLITELKGIGEKRAAYLRELGIADTFDLIRFLPRKYLDLTTETPLKELVAGENALVRGFASRPTMFKTKGGLLISDFKITTRDGVLNAVCYNRPYITQQLKTDREYLFFGMINSKKGVKLINPLIELADGARKLHGIAPVYRKVEGIPAALIKSLIEQAIEVEKTHPCYDSAFAKSNGLPDIQSAFRSAHMPSSMSEAEQALAALSIYELTQIMFAYRLVRQIRQDKRINFYKDNSEKLAELEGELDFELSESQRSAIDDILSDLSSTRLCNRMIAGDVGSGKTVVALFALYHTALSGFQGALMSPTEVLARQHYRTAIKLLSKKGIRIGYYSGSLSKGERESVLYDIRNGVYDIVIGTHALFQESVRFERLALVVTDEVHRFGVAQRTALENKGSTDVLVMSATPLPRTLALVCYSDLDVSYLQYPFERANNISTAFVSANKVNDMLEFLKNADRQSYIICPRIYDDEDDDTIVSAISLYEKLKKGVYKDTAIALLHGRMSEEEKLQAINAFASGRVKILISTTVVEVGIDVSTADNIAIFGAERFGLCQLHQLRGRVGRDGGKAYCFLIADTDNEESLERLSVLKGCADAFVLAEKDLQARGAGDLIGLRQSGFGDLFFCGDNTTAIKRAQEIVDAIQPDSPLSRALTRHVYKLYGDTIFKTSLS